MKTFFSADLHGNKKLYRQLDSYINTEKPKLVILGGDLFPESKNVRETPEIQKDFIEKDLFPRFKKYSENGVEEILVIMGNHDLLLCEKAIRKMEKEGLCHYIHGKKYQSISRFVFFGYSYSPPSPYFLRDFDKKDTPEKEVSSLCLLPDNKGYINRGMEMVPVNNKDFLNNRETIQEELEGFSNNFRNDKFIFVCHAPPLCNFLDLQEKNLHVGSRSVMNFIRKTKPLLSLHGHIHPSPKNSGRFMEKTESTICVQPGQNFNDLYGVFFDTDDTEHTLRHTVLKLS